MAYPASGQEYYYVPYLITNSISFFASICVIMFIIGRLPLKNRICSWLLTVTMCIVIASLSYSYLLAAKCLIQPLSYFKSNICNSMVHLVSKGGVVFICCIIIPFLILVVKLFVWATKRSNRWLWERCNDFNHNSINMEGYTKTRLCCVFLSQPNILLWTVTNDTTQMHKRFKYEVTKIIKFQ